MTWRLTSARSFFGWLSEASSIDKFKRSFDENVRSMMELMNQQFPSIMEMPYKFFIDTIKWKVDLEEEKRKKMEEQTKVRGYNRPVKL